MLRGLYNSHMLKMSVAVAGILGILGLGAPVLASPVSHAAHVARATYAYSPRYLGREVRHAGDLLGVRWVPQRSAAPAGKVPLHVMLKVTLVGPYRSVKVLKADYGKRQQAHGVAVTTHWTTDRAGRAYTSYLAVPRRAKHGFYDLETRVVYTSFEHGGATIIRVK
jgi:hypothetical protein